MGRAATDLIFMKRKTFIASLLGIPSALLAIVSFKSSAKSMREPVSRGVIGKDVEPKMNERIVFTYDRGDGVLATDKGSFFRTPVYPFPKPGSLFQYDTTKPGRVFSEVLGGLDGFSPIVQWDQVLSWVPERSLTQDEVDDIIKDQVLLGYGFPYPV
jgi:hypothetical protein